MSARLGKSQAESRRKRGSNEYGHAGTARPRTSKLSQCQLWLEAPGYFTLDHKRIALLHLVSVTFFFIIGGSFAVLMRINLVEA